jgi:DNA polymerase-3 subunit epsilon
MRSSAMSDIAEDLMARLHGKVLVAHNARFDHSFLKNEFRRLGLDYRTKVLCTVKLSRALMPQLDRHGLDSLIHHHGLHVDSRHRAMGDADLLVQLVASEQDARCGGRVATDTHTAAPDHAARQRVR